MNTPANTITVASRVRYPHVEGVFVDNVMIGWGPQSGALADELRDEARSFADDLHRALPTRRERQVDGVVACMLVLVFVMGMIVIFG